MKCIVCGKEFEAKRKTARFCSEACKQKNKVSVSNNVGVSVSKRDFSVSNDTVKVSVSNPLKRITRPPVRASQEWLASDGYKDLIEELEKKPIEQLEKENYFVPAWKYVGHKKKPNIKELLKENY